MNIMVKLRKIKIKGNILLSLAKQIYFYLDYV